MSSLLIILSTGTDGRWHPGIGDPTPLGWATVFAYFAAALAALRAASFVRASARAPGLEETRPVEALTIARFWTCVALCMVLLGFNKQLDLQTWFTEVMRDLALTQGWYEQRQRYQVAFIAALAVSGVIALGALAFALRRVIGQVLGGTIGLVFISTFVLVRAVSFHHVDRMLGTGRIRLNWVLELSGIAIIFVSAMRADVRRVRHVSPHAVRP